MTSSKAEDFFRDHVEPSLADWKADDTAIHKASSLATNLNHMAEHYWESYSSDSSKNLGAKDLKEFRDQIIARCPEYSQIRDVCDAHKHCKLDRASKTITNSSQTSKRSLGWGEAKWGQGKWGSPEEIVIEEDSGEFHHFSHVAGEVEAFWRGLL